MTGKYVTRAARSRRAALLRRSINADRVAIKREAEKELAEFYPKDADGATTIAFIIVCIAAFV